LPANSNPIRKLGADRIVFLPELFMDTLNSRKEREKLKDKDIPRLQREYISSEEPS
jgi:hypothetical protein